MFRLYATPDGESHFEDIDSVPLGVSQVTFSSMVPGRFVDWHNERRRQLVVTLSGESDITASDGQVRRTRPGTVMLAEDLTGKGHQTRVVGDQGCSWMFVVLAG